MIRYQTLAKCIQSQRGIFMSLWDWCSRCDWPSSQTGDDNDNGLSCSQNQGINWTSAGLLVPFGNTCTIWKYVQLKFNQNTPISIQENEAKCTWELWWDSWGTVVLYTICGVQDWPAKININVEQISHLHKRYRFNLGRNLGGLDLHFSP